jgi:hypothetical protein
MMKVVSGPAMALAPSLTRLTETLNNPAMQQLPDQMAQFNDILAEISKRLTPLTQLAGNAGGFLGGLRLPGFPAAPSAATGDDAPDRQLVVEERPVKKSTTQKSTTQKSTAKRSSSAKSTATRSTAKKAASRSRR